MHELNTIMVGSHSPEALAHNVAAELVSIGYRNITPKETTINAVARQLATTDGFDYDDLQPLAQFNLREQTRQVLVALAETTKEKHTNG